MTDQQSTSRDMLGVVHKRIQQIRERKELRRILLQRGD